MSDNRDAQVTLIAALLQDPRKLVDLSHIEKSYFTDKACRIVFVAMKKYHEDAALKGRIRYAPLEAIERMLPKLLRKTGDPKKDKARRIARRAADNLLDEASGYEVVGDHEFSDALDQVVEGWLDGETRDGLVSIVDTLERHGSEGVHRRLQELAANLTPAINGLSIETLDTGAKQVIIDYERAKTNKGGGKIETFDPMLNKVTSGGGKKGRLWLIAAYAKGGKTQVAKELIYHAATCGLNTAIVTSEQTTSDVRLMLTCRHSHHFISGGLSYNAIEEGRLDTKQEGIMRKVVQDLRTSPAMGKIHYFKTAHGTSIGEVRGMLEAIHQRTPLDVVMIDHTGLFMPTRKRESNSANAAAVMMEIKDLALNFGTDGLWVVACHQISRDGYEKAEKRGGYYIPADMANTAEAERSCDLMLYAYRDQELTDISEIRIGVALDRYGPGEIKGWNLFEHFAHSAVIPIKGTGP